MCRQVIAEFAATGCLVWSVNMEGEGTAQQFGELFPRGFGAENLT